MKRLRLFLLLSILLFSGGLSAQSVLLTPGGGVAMTSGNKVAMASAAVALKIGDTHQGGIIFYLNGTGGGLIAAPSDQGTNIVWGCSGTTTGATSEAVGDGKTNSTTIISRCGDTSIAAYTCLYLDLNGYKDWYLPSLGELYLIYTNLYRKGLGNLKNGPYWSSTEENNNNGKMVNFADGVTYPKAKSDGYYVRAIRKF